MNATRIVTGHDSAGQSRIVLDGPLVGGAFEHTPGFEVGIAWEAAPLPHIEPGPADSAAALTSVVPTQGGTVAMLVTFPPASAGQGGDPAAAGAEIARRLPGLAECFEPDAPGFHRSDTIDYGVVVEGEIWLELDGGVTRCLRQGDVIVQIGTRHAWRNRSEQPARVFFVLVGAQRG
ncbi:cupin domain-containing protein [Pseudothauera rhizosphaerae]|uniref:Cupin domain-containing protein n=1 Tax=Pseudothauera rhizosphaerae TaxID=2565932 RepID=A0A4V3WB73_9RHOO|nr:cupin domain-containing protein [Pseudothauera rhizosphaerae]THF62156.1 cupin domain-containing protein [Pseudothauera rhizosphaerae]